MPVINLWALATNLGEQGSSKVVHQNLGAPGLPGNRLPWTRECCLAHDTWTWTALRRNWESQQPVCILPPLPPPILLIFLLFNTTTEPGPVYTMQPGWILSQSQAASYSKGNLRASKSPDLQRGLYQTLLGEQQSGEGNYITQYRANSLKILFTPVFPQSLVGHYALTPLFPLSLLKHQRDWGRI